MKDPVCELVEELRAHGAPSLAWSLRWGEGGRDPVACAWGRSCSPQHMVALLRVSAHPALGEALRVCNAPVLFEGSDVDRVRSEAIRRIVPTPPTFAELVPSKG